MHQVTIDKEKFRKIVQQNKSKHEQLFHEASAAFYERVNKELKAITECVESHEMNFTHVIEAINQLQRNHPMGHCDEYQQVLDMLDHEEGDKIPLTRSEFEQYVKDEWNWKGGFIASYTANTGKSI